jgi:hypothetical protein
VDTLCGEGTPGSCVTPDTDGTADTVGSDGTPSDCSADVEGSDDVEGREAAVGIEGRESSDGTDGSEPTDGSDDREPVEGSDGSEAVDSEVGRVGSEVSDGRDGTLGSALGVGSDALSSDGSAKLNRPGSWVRTPVRSVIVLGRPVSVSIAVESPGTLPSVPTPSRPGSEGAANAGAAMPTPMAAIPATVAVVRTPRRARLLIGGIPSCWGDFLVVVIRSHQRRQCGGGCLLHGVSLVTVATFVLVGAGSLGRMTHHWTI